MKIIFQSPHMYFREFIADDLNVLIELNSNPNVLKYLHEPAKTRDELNAVLHNTILPQYKLYGYGRWAVCLRETSEFMGWCGLKYIQKDDEIDLGYRFKEPYWGKGYGFEAAKATIDYGFDTLHLKKFFARALPQNVASWKIMEKCGMQYIGDVVDDDGLIVKKYMIASTN